MSNLKGKTIFISGGSRGIGEAIVLRAAQDGANIVIAAKTSEPHPKLPGTIHTVAAAVVEAGGKALPLVVDIRSEALVEDAVKKALDTFGGIDILINNASAISLTGTLQTSMKTYDLMHTINTRGTFLCSQKCIPSLMESENPHILNISPPLNFDVHWFSPHVAYTMAKYGMSLCVLGMADEFSKQGIAVNALWPKTAIDTAAIRNFGGGGMSDHARKPSIMADSAYAILTRNSKECTGNFFIDEEVLAAEGVTDFDQYAVKPGADLAPDFFV